MANITSELRLEQVPTDSPFVPGTDIQYAWDSVSLTAALSCPRRYLYGIIQGWMPKQPGVRIALDFGLLLHAGIEHYHHARSAGIIHELAVQQVLWELYQSPGFRALPVIEDVDAVKAATDEEEEEDNGILHRNAKVRTRYHLFRALVWYFEHYKNDPISVVHLADGRPATEYSFRVGTGRSLSDGTELMLSGHFDLVGVFNDEQFIVDHKTNKGVTRQYKEDFKLSHQMTGYTAGGKIALELPVKGVMINSVSLKVGGVSFERFPTYRTGGQVEEYLDVLEYVGELSERWFVNQYYPMNTSACIFCEYKSICRRDPRMRAGHLNHEYERKPAWNPLANR